MSTIDISGEIDRCVRSTVDLDEVKARAGLVSVLGSSIDEHTEDVQRRRDLVGLSDEEWAAVYHPVEDSL